ncbi:YybS family protein [Evansella sp. AB-P1]|uniref:YybS family protein n=1 Tax=Evansella sp. AB-P1 TaxID=3037653 RepID=UPI00241E8561|nr:YybS family protein [Evansella sp. AB-P1]MDG5789422.1 YybS family protein [Evansella sp. AB-P1]
MERSKQLKEGMKFIAIYILLILLTLFVPFIGLFLMLTLPIPFVIYTCKHGLKQGIILGLIAFFLLFIITPLSLPLTLTFVATGIVIGELYRRKKDAFGVLLGGSLSFIAALILNYIGSIVIFNLNLVEIIQDLIRDSIVISEQMLDFVGQNEEVLVENAYAFIDEIPFITPMIIIVTGISIAFLVQWLSSLFLRQLDYEIALFPPFREWSFPRAFIWYYLFTYIIMLIGTEHGSTMYIVIANLAPILEIVMIIQGFSFIFFYFHSKGKSKAMPIIIVVLTFLLPFMLYIIRILGIIDLGFELRKRLNSKK